MWLILSLLAAVSVATKDAYSKKSTMLGNKYLIVCAMNVFSIPILIAGILLGIFPFHWGIASNTFWFAMIMGVLINILALILYFQSVKLSPISYVIPLMAFIPIFSVPVSYVASIFIPGAFKAVTVSGLGGIILIFIGAYLLNMKEISDKGVLFPIRMLFKEKGSQLMIIVSLLWSISAVFDGIAVRESSSIFYLVIMTLVTSAIMGVIIIVKMKYNDIKEQLCQGYKSFFGVAFFNILGMAFYLLALGMTTQVSYVLAIRSINLLIATFFGYLFFREKNISERLIGTTFMVAGLAVITVFSR